MERVKSVAGVELSMAMSIEMCETEMCESNTHVRELTFPQVYVGIFYIAFMQTIEFFVKFVVGTMQFSTKYEAETHY